MQLVTFCPRYQNCKTYMTSTVLFITMRTSFSFMVFYSKFPLMVWLWSHFRPFRVFASIMRTKGIDCHNSNVIFNLALVQLSYTFYNSIHFLAKSSSSLPTAMSNFNRKKPIGKNVENKLDVEIMHGTKNLFNRHTSL